MPPNPSPPRRVPPLRPYVVLTNNSTVVLKDNTTVVLKNNILGTHEGGIRERRSSVRMPKYQPVACPGMSLDIGAALREGVDRTTERNALLLMVAFVLLGVASAVATDTFFARTIEALERIAEEQGQAGAFDPATLPNTPLAAPIPLWAALALAFALALVGEALSLVTLRTFVSDERERVPGEFLRRRIAWVTANGFVGGIVVGVLVVVGLVFLVIPGLFLYVAFFFVRAEIAVEDTNFVDAMAESWALTRGNRIEVFALGVVLFVVGLLAIAPTVGLGSVDAALASLVGTVLSAVATVFVAATVARAYVQLREFDEPDATGTVEDEDEDDEEDPYAGALGPEDLDPPE